MKKIFAITVTGMLCAPPIAAQSADQLGAIVGVWQSDTTNGTSAVSNCAWTPAHTSVACDQTVTTPTGTQHALSLFTFDAAGRKFVFYGLGHPGDPMRPVALTITGKLWYYGGLAPDQDGRWSRTVNDFSATGSYSWKQEASANGHDWKAGMHGRSVRKS